LDFALKSDISVEIINEKKLEYNILRKKMMKAFEDLLHVKNKDVVDLSIPDNTKIIMDTLQFWEGKKLKNYAICVMPNHVHWVLELNNKDKKGNSIWLDDILKSVKQFSATQINKLEGKKGTLWHKESWDTTIRDDRHLYEAIEYTRNNPVEAGLVKDWRNWKGTLII
jgi:REP element-mobilizing transposase RayT